MTSVLNKFKEQKPEITLQSIQAELLHVKSEVRDVKETLNNLEVELITNKILNNLPPNHEPNLDKTEFGE